MKAAKERAWALYEELERALEAGEIDEATWHRRAADVVVPAYLAADNPRAQSGHSGDAARWAVARGGIAEAFDRDGTFLDVGCANGHLIETIVTWTSHRIEPYGLDISPELVALAQARLPAWRDRFYTGNALHWRPPRRFDFVRTGLDYVPRRREADLLRHLLDHALAPGGRLIVGTYNEERAGFLEGPSVEDRLRDAGFAISGRSERAHLGDPRLAYRVLWIDGPAM